VRYRENRCGTVRSFFLLQFDDKYSDGKNCFTNVKKYLEVPYLVLGKKLFIKSGEGVPVINWVGLRERKRYSPNMFRTRHN